MEVKTKVTITDQRLKDLLCCACEGGSNHWVAQVTYSRKRDWPSKAEFWHELPVYNHPVTFHVDRTEGEPVKGKGFDFILDLKGLEQGVRLMAEEYPTHWHDVLNENEDAATGDVFLQLSLFGEVVYG